MTRFIHRLIFRIRMMLGQAAPRTISGRRPVIFTQADLDAALAVRKARRPNRSAAALKGHATRRAGRIEQMRGAR